MKKTFYSILIFLVIVTLIALLIGPDFSLVMIWALATASLMSGLIWSSILAGVLFLSTLPFSMDWIEKNSNIPY